MTSIFKKLAKLGLIFSIVFIASLSASIVSDKDKHLNKALLLEVNSNDSKTSYIVEVLNGERSYIEKPTPQLIKLNILNSIKNKLKTTEIKEQRIVLSAINDDFFESVNELVNVKEVGAICDGKTDDTEALQRALDKVAKVSGGGGLYVPTGVCMSNPLAVHSNTIIYGTGKSSVIKLLPQNLDPAEHWGILRAVGTKDQPVRNVHIGNLLIDGSKDLHSGKAGSFHESVTLDWGEKSTITNLTIINTIHNGIQVDGARNVIISDNYISNADGWGIHLSDNGDGPERRTEKTIVVGNLVINSGYRTKRGGLDQNPSSSGNSFIENLSFNNYKNYEIHNHTSVFRNNISINESEL